VGLAAALKRDGFVTVEKLRELGYSQDAVTTLVASHQLTRLHRGIYGDARSQISLTARLTAALLAAGPEAFLSHQTAAQWRQLSPRRTNDPIHITVVGNRTPEISGIKVHRTARATQRGEVTTYLGLRASTAKRILVELAPKHDSAQLREIVGQAVSRAALDLKRLPKYLRSHARRPGLAKLKHALRGYIPDPRAKSSLEREIAAAIASDPRFTTEPERNVYLGDADGIKLEADFWFGAERVALESDGRHYHARLEAQERDRRKDAWYARNDIRFLRITDLRWADEPQACLDDLHEILLLARREQALPGLAPPAHAFPAQAAA
jgi:hypothetical protein